jgi:NDP-sugar pyrophosphorylase family protein
LTQDVPKSLLEAGGEPFIFHQLRLLKGSGLDRIVILAGYLGEMIEQVVGDGSILGLQVEYAYDGEKLLGTAGAVRQALSKLGPEFFLLYGDSYLPCDYRRVYEAFKSQGQPALMTVYRNQGRFDTSNVEFASGHIVAYDKVRLNPRMAHIDYGLGLFARKCFLDLPADEPRDLAQVYQDLLARGQLGACEVFERFYEVGSFAGLAEFQAFITQGGS